MCGVTHTLAKELFTTGEFIVLAIAAIHVCETMLSFVIFETFILSTLYSVFKI